MSKATERDKYLVRLILKDKKEAVKAQNELYHKYKGPLQTFIFNIVKNEEDAKDLVMVTFSRAFKYLNTYNFSNAFSTWLFRIATNKSIDAMRKKKSLPFFLDTDTYSNIEEILFNTNTEELDPEELLIQKETKKTLHKYMSKLNPSLYRIMKLRYFEHMSYKDIAKEMNVGIGTVKAQLHKSKYLLKKLIKDDKQTFKFGDNV